MYIKSNNILYNMAAASSEDLKWCKAYDCRFPFDHVTVEHRCGICKVKGHGQIECKNQKSKDRLINFHSEVLPYKMNCTRSKCTSKNLHTTRGHFCNLCNKQHSHYNCDLNPEFVLRKAAENVIIKNTMYKLNCPVCRTDNEYSDEHISSSVQEIKCCICTDSEKKFVFLPKCRHFSTCTDCAEQIRVPLNDPNNIVNKSFGPDVPFDILNEAALEKFRGIDEKVYTTFYAGMGHQWFVRRDRCGELIECMIYDGQFGGSEIDGFINGYRLIN